MYPSVKRNGLPPFFRISFVWYDFSFWLLSIIVVYRKVDRLATRPFLSGFDKLYKLRYWNNPLLFKICVEPTWLCYKRYKMSPSTAKFSIRLTINHNGHYRNTRWESQLCRKPRITSYGTVSTDTKIFGSQVKSDATSTCRASRSFHSATIESGTAYSESSALYPHRLQHMCLDSNNSRLFVTFQDKTGWCKHKLRNNASRYSVIASILSSVSWHVSCLFRLLRRYK